MTRSQKKAPPLQTEPRPPGVYWFQHSPNHPVELVKLTPDGLVWFIGDWRARPVADLGQRAMWGERIVAPEQTAATQRSARRTGT
jgi:hypothetical protein